MKHTTPAVDLPQMKLLVEDDPGPLESMEGGRDVPAFALIRGVVYIAPQCSKGSLPSAARPKATFQLRHSATI